jgi:ABC-type branched-subunit amino acid transport system ATPase component
MLVCHDIRAGYGDAEVIRSLSLEVKKGEVVAIIGRNGAGKTTLLKAIMGLVKVNAGKILFNGKDITNLRPYERARLGIGYVPQGRGLFYRLTVMENLKAVCRGSSDIINEVLEIFPVLRERAKQVAGTLSGGEQQMLAIARAMVNSPSLLIMDEPFTGLAPAIISKIIDKLKYLRNEKGLTILLTEQKLFSVLDLADKFCVLSMGRIALTARKNEVLEDKELFRCFLELKV